MMLNTIIGLVLVMTSNILLGSSLAKLKKKFNKKTFVNGITKSALIIISVGLMYLCSYLNPNIMVANVNGQEVDIISGMEMIFVAGIIMYGYQSLVKLRDLLKLKSEITEKGE